MQATTVNRLINHSVENSLNNWLAWQLGGNTIIRDAAVGYIGSGSIRISNSKRFECRDISPIYRTGKRSYLYPFVLGKNIKCQAPSGIGAELDVGYYNSQNVFTYIGSAMKLHGTNDWTRISMEFDFPADAQSNTVAFIVALNYTSGIAWFDNMQLECADAAGSL